MRGGGDRTDRGTALGSPQGRLDDLAYTACARVLPLMHVSSSCWGFESSTGSTVDTLSRRSLAGRPRFVMTRLHGLLYGLSTRRNDPSGGDVLNARATTPPDPSSLSIVERCPCPDNVRAIGDRERIPQDLVVGFGVVASRGPGRVGIRAGLALAFLSGDIRFGRLTSVRMICGRTRLRRGSADGSDLIPLLPKLAVTHVGRSAV